MSHMDLLTPEAGKILKDYAGERLEKIRTSLEQCDLDELRHYQGAAAELRFMLKTLENHDRR